MDNIQDAIGSFIQNFDPSERSKVVIGIASFKDRIGELVGAIKSENRDSSRDLIHTLKAEAAYLRLDYLLLILDQTTHGNMAEWVQELQDYHALLIQALERIDT